MDAHILAIDDDPNFLIFLKLSLNTAYKLTTAKNISDAKSMLQTSGIDLILLDIELGSENGLDFLKMIKAGHPELDVVIVTGHKDPKLVVKAVKMGASDYLVKPFEIEELVSIIEKLKPYREIKEKHAALLTDINESSSVTPMLGSAAAFQEVLSRAKRLKGHKVNVLIEGESGSGKELFARYVHNIEGKSDRPFVVVNCAAIPENLLETELFGCERGAFTGAYRRRIGKFELANNGDIFLDEISCLKWDLQAKILRALQEKEIHRLGSNTSIKVDFRLIAATNDNLEQLVKQGKFRHDLFYRLRVAALKIPPLRQRLDDIPLLAEYFLKKYSKDARSRFSQETMFILKNYSWPGNIRELENLIHGLAVFVSRPEITPEDLPEWILKRPQRDHFLLPEKVDEVGALKQYLNRLESTYISHVLSLTNGDKKETAILLKISRSQLYEKLKTTTTDEQDESVMSNFSNLVGQIPD